MLDTLRRIVQEVSSAANLEEALNIIVNRIKHAMNVDVCSIYLKSKTAQEYVLMASAGVDASAIGRVRLALGEGLVSLVGERGEPLNLDDALSHPSYIVFPETDRQNYYAFLGVPIIHHRAVMGVLLVRQQLKRKFDEQEEAFLVTAAAQLAGAIAHAESSGATAALLSKAGGRDWHLDGLPGAPGVCLGTVMVVYPPADLDSVPDRTVEDVEEEVNVFRAAVEVTRGDIEAFIEQAGKFTKEDKALFEAYLLMLDSDSIVGKTIERIRAGSWASGALRDTIHEHVRLFDAMEDAYLRERASDVRDLGRRILMCLQSGSRKAPPYPDRTVLVGEEISATMLAEVPRDRLVGVVSVKGSSSSHVAILANAFGIPAVVGLEDLPVARLDRCEIVVDGYRGRIYISPSPAVRVEYQRLAREEAHLAAELAELKQLPALTLDGFRMPLYVNMGLISDLALSLNSGAEGVGLYRTEFPYMVRDRFPGEEEQRLVYRQILTAFSPRPVVLRTLDIGGDKSLSYFPISEDNPFLGWRGIRVTLDHPDIFLAQLRAMLKANADIENLNILLPMVSSVGELDEAVGLIDRARRELSEEGINVARPRIGAMLEVPSTLFLIDALAKRADFFSIGTNDLTQYLLAVDRNNSRVARLYDSLHPAVLSVIKYAVDQAHYLGKPVGVCGEMAGDPLATLPLVGVGVDSLSMNVSSLGRVKWVIRNINHSDAQSAVKDLLKLEDSRSVRRYLESVLGDAGLGGALRTVTRPAAK